MSTWRDKAIVLKRRSLRDADRHYTVFTEKRGKTVILAKGSRCGKSKMTPHLALPGIVDIMVAEGRLIDRLAGAALSRPFRSLLDSLPKMAAAQSFLLAVDALTRRELPDERVFHLLHDFLAAIDEMPAVDERHPAFDVAIFKLLDLLGQGLELDACVRCRQAAPPHGNALNILSGGLECPDCRDPAAMDLSSAAGAHLRRFRVATLAAAAAEAASSPARQELRFIIDLSLAAHLESRLPALKYLQAVAR